MKSLVVILISLFAINTMASDLFSPEIRQYQERLNKAYPSAKIDFKKGAELASDYVLNDRLQLIESAFRNKPVQPHAASDLMKCCNLVCGDGCGAARVTLPNADEIDFNRGIDLFAKP